MKPPKRTRPFKVRGKVRNAPPEPDPPQPEIPDGVPSLQRITGSTLDHMQVISSVPHLYQLIQGITLIEMQTTNSPDTTLSGTLYVECFNLAMTELYVECFNLAMTEVASRRTRSSEGFRVRYSEFVWRLESMETFVGDTIRPEPIGEVGLMPVRDTDHHLRFTFEMDTTPEFIPPWARPDEGR